MGCNNSKSDDIKYHELYDKETLKDASGPFVNAVSPDYENWVKEIGNKSWVDYLNTTIKKFENKNAFGYRKHKNSATEFEETHSYLTYKQVSDWAYNFAKNIKDLGLVEKKNYDFEGEFSFLGIFARNCADWFIADLGCQRDSVTTVTFYNTLGEKAFDHIFEQTECKTICVSNDSLDNLIKYHKQYNFKSLQNVIIFDLTLFADETMFQKVKDAGLTPYSLSDLIKDKGSKAELVISQPETIFTVCYTSGTTSLPKGVKLSQNNFLSGSYAIPDCHATIDEHTVHISYLPLAHVLERVCIHLVASRAGLTCFIASGDVRRFLSDDIALTKPTILVAVPKVLTMFVQKITGEFAKLTGLKKSLADRAYRVKIENFKSTGTLTHSFYDKFIFAKIRNKFGGRVKAFITGSAPLPNDIGTDIKIFFSAPIIEAYGMTEIAGALTVTSVHDTKNGNAGAILRTCQLKLADKKEFNYHSKTELDGEPSPTGEICCRGLSIFKGYFLDKKNTEETFDEDGWLKTGDVGRILPGNKGIRIIDRVKEIFKLSQGEYIAPSKLENVYAKCKYILQICIYGNSYHSFVIALINANKQEVERFLVEKEKMKPGEDVKKFYDDKDLHAEIKKEFDELAKANKLNSLEKPQKFIITQTDFTIDNELLTPTMKLVRKKIEKFFEKEIDSIYEQSK